MMEWISVDDALPQENQRVIYYFEHTGISIGTYNQVEYPEEVAGKSGIYGNCFSGSGGYLVDDVTHWMPLPKPPTGKDE
jgi:hypothetical protein